MPRHNGHMRETGLVIEVPEATATVAHWRERHDPIAGHGMPPHITILYPFVPPELFDDSAVDEVTRVLAAIAPVHYSLTSTEQFPGAIWLRPVPDRPFRALTRRLVEAFPDYLPYGGQYPDSIPHLTVAIEPDPATQASLYDRIDASIGDRLPIECTATAVSVFMTDDHGRWSKKTSVSLGAR